MVGSEGERRVEGSGGKVSSGEVWGVEGSEGEGRGGE